MIETTDKRGNTTPCKYRRRNPERFLRRKIRAIRLSGLQNSPQFAVGKKHQHIAVHFIMSRSRQNVAESLLPIQIGAEHPGRSHVLTDGQTACFRGLVGTHKPVAGSEPRKTSVLTENDGKEVAFHRYGTTVELHKLPFGTDKRFAVAFPMFTAGTTGGYEHHEGGECRQFHKTCHKLSILNL